MTQTISLAIYPRITRDTKYDFKSYTVKVGQMKADDPETYLVVNKETEVVEFNHEVLSFVLEWVNHFQKRLDAIVAGKPLDEQDEVADIVRNIN